MSGRIVLITGGTGFVGANLARRLLQDGAAVHLLVRPSYRDWRIADIRNHIQLHEASLSHADQVHHVLKTVRPDEVYHLAAYGAYSSQQDLDVMIDTNVRGTAHLLSACSAVGIRLFVNTGSSSEYGYCNSAPHEETLPVPNSHYAVTKLTATNLCQLHASKVDFPIATLRLYSVYGSFEEPTRLMPTLLSHAHQKRLPPLVDPDIERDFIHIDDVVDAYLCLAKDVDAIVEPGCIFNVCTGTGVKMRDLVETVRQLFTVDAIPEWGSMPNRSWDAKHWVGDPSRLQQEFNWRASRPLESGLQQFFDWIGDVAWTDNNLRQIYQRVKPQFIP